MAQQMAQDGDRRFPYPIPTGWFAVGWSDELEAGAVRSLHYFGRDLVLFRTEQGGAHVLDAFCPHLGAHLGDGRVEGEVLVCPFHAWKWNGAGECVGIPYASRIPPKARMACWPVVEHSGAIFVWFDPVRGAPTFELPPHPELSDGDWVPVERHEFQVASTPQEIAENAHDPAHFAVVHGVPAVPEYRAEFDGPRLVAENRGELETPGGLVETWIRGTSYGLGVGHLRTRGLTDMAQLLLQTPIDAGHVHVRWQFAVPRDADDRPNGLGIAFAREFVRQFRQDIPIWERKAYLDRPVLCDGDGQIGGFRRWANQFYDRAARP
jgi:phenylpropionate dioxygenase-like ring-hydroxylating dioxygenase large terminal subunit